MDLGVLDLNEPGLRTWLHADRTQPSDSHGATEWSSWDPLEVGAETDVIELLASAQRDRLLTGPAQVGPAAGPPP